MNFNRKKWNVWRQCSSKVGQTELNLRPTWLAMGLGGGSWQRSRNERRKKIKTGSCYTESGRNRSEMHLLMFSHDDASAVAQIAQIVPKSQLEAAGQRKSQWAAIEMHCHAHCIPCPALFSLGLLQYWRHTYLAAKLSICTLLQLLER